MIQVWLFHSLTGSRWDDQSAVNRHNSRNGRWYRLDPAPFSPRAYMAHHLEVWPAVWPNVPPPTANCTVLLVYGGETGYACNNRRLGVCSAEVWQLAICRLNMTLGPLADDHSDPDTWEVVADLGLSFHWVRAWVDIPAPARCALVPVFERRQTAGTWYSLITGVGGGQRSYNDTTCQADIETLSDLWFGLWPKQYGENGTWLSSSSLPFSPRRSVVVDDALVSTDELVGAEESPLDKSVSVAGGIRYISHRFDPVANRSVITAAEMYADVWSCTLLITSYRPFQVECDWHYSFPQGQIAFTTPPAPSGSLPVPLASAASALFPTGRDLLNMRVGGATTAEAIEELTRLQIDNRTVPGFPAALRLPLPPVSLLRQPNAFRSAALPLTGAVSSSDVAAARRHLPSNYSLSEEELNSRDSTLATGTDVLLAHTLLYQQGYAKALFTTWGDGLAVGASHDPSALSPSLPRRHASGSARPLFVDFPLRRVDHAMASTWDTAIISGGQSSGVYYNDWLTFEACVCFWPDDPSYKEQLGAVEYRGEVQQLAASYRRYWSSPNQTAAGDEQLLDAVHTGMFRAGVEIEVACAPGWHFHPPLASEVALLACAANSLWVDAELGAVRRCVRDELDCDWPWVDAGYTTCVEPLPVVEGIEVVTAVGAWRDQPVNTNAATVTSVPASDVEVSGQLLLVVRGQWLTEPVTVSVGAAICLQPSMRNLSQQCSSDGCVDFARAVICLLSRDIGIGELVSVTTGRGSRTLTVSSLRTDSSFRGRVPLTVSADEPEVVSLSAAGHMCNASTTVNRTSLTGCSNQHGPLPIEVCGVNLAFRSSASTGYVTAYVNVTAASEPVPCSAWTVRLESFGKCSDTDLSALACVRQLLCGRCHVQPVMSKQLLTVAIWSLWPTGQLLSNNKQQADPLTRPSIEFSTCAAGSRLAIDPISRTEQCIPCQAGYYSLDGAQQCIPCYPGSFTAENGSVTCTHCSPGTHSAITGATSCVACNGSSWQSLPSQLSCSTCDGGQYRTLPSAPSEPPASVESPVYSALVATDGRCLLCPSGAECFSDGSMYAQPGYYLLVIDRATGEVGSLLCSTTACVGAGRSNTSASTAESVRQVTATGLTLVNYCGRHRQVDGGNTMCAECVDEYSEVRGVCVYCPSPSYGWLLLVVVLAWLLVYLLHRATLHLSSASTVAILVYFVQMSALFLPANLFAPLNLVNLQLFTGLNPQSVCLLPLDGLGAFMSRIVSPLVVFVLLALLLALQLSARWLLSHNGYTRRGRGLKRVYRFLFPSLDGAAVSPSRRAPPSDDSAVARQPLSQFRQPLLELSLSADDVKAADDSQQHTVDDAAATTRAPLSVAVPSPVDSLQPLEADIAHSDTAVDDDAGARPAAPSSDGVPAILRSYRRTLLRLLVFSYNSFATAALSFFHTRQVGEDGRRLWEYPTVNPSDASYRALRPFMAVLLTLLVAVVPLLAAVLYYLHRRDKQRLLSLKTSVAAEEEVGDEAAAVAVQQQQQQQAVLVEVMIGTFRPSHWPLAVMVLFRRLLLTTIATFVVSSSYVWLTAVNTSLLVLHIATWPYRDELDNRVEALTLSLLVVQTTLLSDWQASSAVLVSSPLTAVRAVLLWLMLLLPFVLVLAGSVKSFYLRARRRALRVDGGKTSLLHILASAGALLACGLCSRGDDDHPATIATLSVSHFAEHGRQASLLDLGSP